MSNALPNRPKETRKLSDFWGQPQHQLSALVWRAKAQKSRKSVIVRTNQSTWRVVSQPKWLKLSAKRGANGTKLTVTASRNRSAARTGLIVIQAGKAKQLMAVVQRSGRR
ncbi:MAG: BACON domain-containing protein [Bifidobacteriaceae bacterium]|jgi:hypothetical protein|nr:BACON domain-containing protein [Bifidobacteriaceae bacterium]